MIRLFKTEAAAKRRAADFTFPVTIVPYTANFPTRDRFQLERRTIYVIQSGRGEFVGTFNYLTTNKHRWITGRLPDLIWNATKAA